MQEVEYAKQRYVTSLAEIDRLKQSDFPYPHSKAALTDLQKAFKRRLEDLSKLGPTTEPAVRRNACSQSLDFLDTYTPLLGMVLRSTNIRNAFEIYSPLLRLAKSLLGPSVKLLLSSEWDYNAFVYIPQTELAGYVLIGLPAQESANALLAPLAGHELGHNVWDDADLYSALEPTVKKSLLNLLENELWDEYHGLFPGVVEKGKLDTLFVRETWLPAFRWAMRQLEEVFCDVMGLRLFSEAYLHAFAYLVSPGVPGTRPMNYPDNRDRVGYMLQAVAELDIAPPVGFMEFFNNGEEVKDPASKFLVKVADATCKAHLTEIISKAVKFADDKSAPQRTRKNVNAIAGDFRLVVPARTATTMTDIVNAAWECHHDSKLWNDVPQITPDDRRRVLNDLVLKSLEVLEVSERLKGS